MFQRGDDAFFVLERGVALKSAHGGDAQLRDQIRIFAVGFLDPAPARIARHVHDRRERLVRAAGARFLGGHGEKRFHQTGIERRAQADGLGKAGAAHRRRGRAGIPRGTSPGCRAGCVRGKTSGWRWSARPSRARSCLCPASLGRPTWPRPWPFLNAALAFFRSKFPVGIHERLGFLLPDAHHLRGLFLERHARQQVLDPPGDGNRGVFINGRVGGGRFFHDAIFQTGRMPPVTV